MIRDLTKQEVADHLGISIQELDAREQQIRLQEARKTLVDKQNREAWETNQPRCPKCNKWEYFYFRSGATICTKCCVHEELIAYDDDGLVIQCKVCKITMDDEEINEDYRIKRKQNG